MKRTALARMSQKRRAALPAYAAAKAALPDRCEAKIAGVCTGYAEDAHHVHPRGRGGPLVPGEGGLRALCRACHSWAHTNPRLSRELGLLR